MSAQRVRKTAKLLSGAVLEENIGGGQDKKLTTFFRPRP